MRFRNQRTRTLKYSLVALVALIMFGMLPAVSASKAAPPKQADPTVLEWNLHAMNAFSNAPTAPTPGAGQPPQVAVLHVAMVQGAIYDAVTMIKGGYQPYLDDLPQAPSSASTAAAIATAAHHVIVGVEIVPPLSPVVVDRVDALLADSIASATATDGAEAVAAGIAAGEAAAAAMLEARADDGRYVPYQIPIGTEPGEWRPVPPATSGDPFAWVGTVDPFMLKSPSQFRSEGPQDLNSNRYAREYNEVKRLGGPTADGRRNPKQEAVARFFMVNPLELYNRAFRTLAASEGLTVTEQARFFAMLNMAGADALINCFNDKIHWNFWRPATAIHFGDSDGNPHTAGDPNWTSMVPTPAYSDHASGYNCITAAFMHTADEFFSDRTPRRRGQLEFALVRIVPGEPEITRTYKRFTDVIKDTIDARVYQGIHFRTSDTQGAKIGRDVADWMDRLYFRRAR